MMGPELKAHSDEVVTGSSKNARQNKDREAPA